MNCTFHKECSILTTRLVPLPYIVLRHVVDLVSGESEVAFWWTRPLYHSITPTAALGGEVFRLSHQ
uniref:Uncharacterized protein n=1 Tax=Physcomitrium patens TaxID=3218 RepID=A0A7I4C4G4_PHYPA